MVTDSRLDKDKWANILMPASQHGRLCDRLFILSLDVTVRSAP